MRRSRVVVLGVALALAIGCQSFGADTPPTAPGTDGGATTEAGATADGPQAVDGGAEAAMPVGPNLTPTGDFESSSGPNDCGPAWSPFQATIKRVAGGHMGSANACRVCQGIALMDFSLGETPPLEVAIAGHSYRITAWLKGTTGSPDNVIIDGRIWTEKKGDPTTDATQKWPITQDLDWQEISLDFTVPGPVQPGQMVDVYFQMPGSSVPNDTCVELDDVQVYRLE